MNSQLLLRIKLVVKFLIVGYLFFIITMQSASAQNQLAGIASFDYAALNIEKLIDNNTLLAQSELQKYQPRFQDLSLTQQISYLNLLTDIYIIKGQYHLAKQESSKGLNLALQLSNPSLLISELLYNRGFSYESMGEIELAFKDYNSGLTLAKSLHDNILTARGLVNIGAIYYLTDRYEKSLIALNDAYNIATQTNDEELKGLVNSELGILYAHLERGEQAMVYYQQAYQHYKNANKITLSLNALINIGINHISNNEFENAISVYKTVLSESEGIAPHHIMYSTYSGLSWANLEKETPDVESSYQYLLKSKEYLGSIEQYDIEQQYYVDEAFILFKLNRFDEVLESIEKVEGILATQMPLGHLKMQVQISIVNLKSKTYSKLGQHKLAYQLQEQRLLLTRFLQDKKYTQSVAEVRLSLEAKEADLQKQVLKNKQTLQQISLLEEQEKQEKQKLFVFFIAVVALVFAWLLAKLIQGQHSLYIASSTDMLTGIANRRELMRKGKKLLQQAKSKKADFSVLMIDIDHFKNINDRYGHSAGDEVLKKIVSLGEEFMRKTDVFGRFGGEEFIAFLPNTSTAQAIMIAERFRLSVEQCSWSDIHEAEEFNLISISIGVANSIEFANANTFDLTTLINQSDKLLYQAKSQGRNKVCS